MALSWWTCWRRSRRRLLGTKLVYFPCLGAARSRGVLWWWKERTRVEEKQVRCRRGAEAVQNIQSGKSTTRQPSTRQRRRLRRQAMPLICQTLNKGIRTAVVGEVDRKHMYGDLERLAKRLAQELPPKSDSAAREYCCGRAAALACEGLIGFGAN